MPRHIFLTQRPQAIPRWLESFPEAEVSAMPKPGTTIVDLPGEALIWLHLMPVGTELPGELVSLAARSAPGCAIVVLTNQPVEQEGMACLEAGASGYISALSNPEMLRQVALVVQNGGIWVGNELLARLRTSLAGLRLEDAAADRLSVLSAREREVAMAVAAGESNKEIARDLDITERTVKAHLSAIFERLGVRDRMRLSILVNNAKKPSGRT